MIIEFSVMPIGKGESLSELVAKVIDIVDVSGIPYKITPMGTIVEGDWNDLMELIKECHFKMRQYSSRVITSIKIDDRESARGRIKGKIEHVEEILGRELKK